MSDSSTIYDEIRKAAGEILKYEPEQLLQRGAYGGQVPFAEIASDLRGARDIASLAEGASFESMPLQTISELPGLLAALGDRLKRINDYHGHAAMQPHEIPQTLIRELRQRYADLFKNGWAVIAFAHLTKEDARNIAIREKAKVADALVDELQAKLGDAKAALETARDAAAMVAVAGEAKHFDALTKSFREESATWLRYSGIAIVGTIILTAIFYFLAPELGVMSAAQAVQSIFAKLVMLSVATGATVFCARNYASSKHNAILNEHRATTLSTFQAFVAGASDQKIKDAILLQAAKSAFSMGSTGYLRREPPLTPGNNVMELIPQVVPGSK